MLFMAINKHKPLINDAIIFNQCFKKNYYTMQI